MPWDRKYVHFLGLALEAVPEEKRRLGSILFLVAVMHFLAFCYVRVSYPSPLPRQESRSLITFFAPDLVPEDAGLVKSLWFDVNDPSRLMRIRRDWMSSEPLEIKLERPEDQPGIPVLLPSVGSEDLDAPQLPLAYKAALGLQPPLRRFRYPQIDQPTLASQTTTYWEDDLRSRWIGSPWSLPTVTADLLEQCKTTVLLLAVNPQGGVEHVLIESSSGKSDVDLMAVDAAQKLHFQPVATGGLQWGRVSIFWKFSPASQAAASNAN